MTFYCYSGSETGGLVTATNPSLENHPESGGHMAVVTLFIS